MKYILRFVKQSMICALKLCLEQLKHTWIEVMSRTAHLTGSEIRFGTAPGKYDDIHNTIRHS